MEEKDNFCKAQVDILKENHNILSASKLLNLRKFGLRLFIMKL